MGNTQKANPATAGLKKTGQLVMCLARLHNFCINGRLGAAPPSLATDSAVTSSFGGIELEANEMNENSPEQLLHGGGHFEGTVLATAEQRRNHQRRAHRANGGVLPQDLLCESVVEQDLKQLTPRQ